MPPANETSIRKIIGYNGVVSPVFGAASFAFSGCVVGGTITTDSAVAGSSVVGCSAVGSSVVGSSVVGSVISLTSEIFKVTVILGFVLPNEAGPFVSYKYATVSPTSLASDNLIRPDVLSYAAPSASPEASSMLTLLKSDRSPDKSM